jgi:hypothetical protein
MNNKMKIEAVIEQIKKEGIKDEYIGADEVYMTMKDYTLEEIAKEIANLINLVYNVRDILEGE